MVQRKRGARHQEEEEEEEMERVTSLLTWESCHFGQAGGHGKIGGPAGMVCAILLYTSG